MISEEEAVRLKVVAQDPTTSPDVLYDIAMRLNPGVGIDEETILEFIAMNPNISERIFYFLFHSKRYYKFVLQNPALPMLFLENPNMAKAVALRMKSRKEAERLNEKAKQK